MRNKHKTKTTFFWKLSFTTSFPTLPPWRAPWDGGCHQFLTLYFCHSFLFTPFSCPSVSAPQDTALHKLFQCGCPHKAQCLNNKTVPPWAAAPITKSDSVQASLDRLQFLPGACSRGLSMKCTFLQGTSTSPGMGSSTGCRVDLLHCGLPWAQEGQPV